jgi:small subunit ribosomal protein S6
MMVLHPDLGEAGTKELVERLRSVLESGQATIRNVEEWGLRELAYTIGKQRKAYYVLLEYDAKAPAVAELERQLKLSDRVLRFLTVQQIRNKRTAAPVRKPTREDEGFEEMA